MRTHSLAAARAPGLDLEVYDEHGRVVDLVTVRDLGSLGADDKAALRRRPRRHLSNR